VGIAQRGKRPTSGDVARVAGVSRTTVSYVLNDVPVMIPEETRARVRAAVDELGYHPHEAARSLRSQASRIIGLAIPEAANAHHQDTANGVEAYARDHGYSVFRSITNFQFAEERRCVQWLRERRFDALILSSGLGSALLDDMDALLAQGAVITGLGFDDPRIDAVRQEPVSGERQALRHLADLGHRRIGHIYGVADQDVYRARLDTCLQIQRALGLPVSDDWVRRCGPTPDEGYRATRDLLSACAGGEGPTALVAVNDLVAGAVLAALHAEGVAIPGEMSVISFDNTSLSAYTVPPLTTVDCEARAMGERAARLTIERLADPSRAPVHLETRARLVVRGSTGPAVDDQPPHGGERG